MMTTFIRQHTTRIFLIGIALGFAVLLVELALINHNRGGQLIAVIACVLGIVLSLTGLVPRPNVRRVVAVVFAVLALSGVYGFIGHRASHAKRVGEVAEAMPVASSDVVRGAFKSFTNNPPTLAPLALSGFAIFGVLTLLSAEAAPATQAVVKPRMQGALK